MRKELQLKIRKIIRHYVVMSKLIGSVKSNVVKLSVRQKLAKYFGSNMGNPINDFEAKKPTDIKVPGTMSMWRYHSNLRLWHSSNFNMMMDVLLETPVPGLWNATTRATYKDVFDAILNLEWPGDVYIIGGAVRDGLRREIPNDIDISVSCPPADLLKMCEAKGWHFMSTGDYFLIGDKAENEYLEGKDIFAQLGPLYKGEFCMNSVVYDVRNRLIIDRSGYGIKDSIEKRIRILEPSPKIWNWWLDEGKIFRLYKFVLRGYQAFDDQIKFILAGTPNVYCKKTMLRRCRVMFKRLHCMKDEFRKLIFEDLDRLFTNESQKGFLENWYTEFIDAVGSK